MKVCEVCGNEIATKDGENRCSECDDCRRKIKTKSRQLKRDREQAMRDLGLTKVRGNLGGTYWE